MSFLPLFKNEMSERGWNEADIVIVTGDAYVDHPSFGTAIIARVLESRGFRVCIVSQPQCAEDLMRFGRPKLAFYINGGNIDPMVAHYTVAKKKRASDLYSPGGVMGLRPDRATVTYCSYARSVSAETPIVIGGVEASLRRFAHYDYWDNSVHPSILEESGADLLIYGMGEKQAVMIAEQLNHGVPISRIRSVRGTCFLAKRGEEPEEAIVCPSFSLVKAQTADGFRDYAVACRIQQNEHDFISGRVLTQEQKKSTLVQLAPMAPLTQAEFDSVYELPYERNYHPSYEGQGGVPAIEEVKFSITHSRGCFGACNFCSIAFHQGRFITSRSKESLIREAELLTRLPDFKGYIHDIGGPTANFRAPACESQKKNGLCKNKKCLAPKPCKNIVADHSEYLSVLREIRRLPRVKKVFIRSGIRFDYLLLDRDERFFKELVEHHVSGQLKVAPEHCSDRVLKVMGKPSFSVYEAFRKRFYELTKSMGKKQYLVPYLMSSHPGSTMQDAIELAVYLKKEKMRPEQVQDFYPTPGTVSTCMYYTGLDPFTLKPVYVAKTREEKASQRALLQYFRPENRKLILSALKQYHREDLIGFGGDCLIAPDKSQNAYEPHQKSIRQSNSVRRKTSLTKHLKGKKMK